MNQSVICSAIKNRQFIQFYYNLGNDPGIRIVEPHMLAYNEVDHLTISAWFVRGHSASNEGPGWREYLISGVSDVTLLQEHFSGPREDYNPTGGKKFKNIQCAL